MLYGSLPRDLGPIDITPTEMMFWMYLPISTPGDHSLVLPDNLRQYLNLIREVRWDHHERFVDSYVYLTAKTLWVGNGKDMNRPGWHCDGFGTKDINYIWSDRSPTEFLSIPDGVKLSEDCDRSLLQMHGYGLRPGMYGGEIVTYPDKHLLRLDARVIHRVAEDVTPGMRTFVKVSISENRYDLIGNSINHGLPESHWPLVERAETRNHPSSENT